MSRRSFPALCAVLRPVFCVAVADCNVVQPHVVSRVHSKVGMTPSGRLRNTAVVTLDSVLAYRVNNACAVDLNSQERDGSLDYALRSAH